MNIEKVVEKLIVKSCRNPLREVKIIILLVQKGVLIPLSYAKGRNPLREGKIIILRLHISKTRIKRVAILFARLRSLFSERQKKARGNAV